MGNLGRETRIHGQNDASEPDKTTAEVTAIAASACTRTTLVSTIARVLAAALLPRHRRHMRRANRLLRRRGRGLLSGRGRNEAAHVVVRQPPISSAPGSFVRSLEVVIMIMQNIPEWYADWCAALQFDTVEYGAGPIYAQQLTLTADAEFGIRQFHQRAAVLSRADQLFF